MKKAFLTLAGLLLIGSVALAQPYGRTFVSAQTGLDANPCLPTSPCRTLARALTQTQYGGEIVVLDAGGYGSVLSITQSVQIQVSGVYAGMTAAASGAAININAPGGTVVLRGLNLNGTGATYGVLTSAATLVHLDGCTISGFSSWGVYQSTSATAQLLVTDSVLRENAHGGVRIATSSGAAQGTAIRSRFERNGLSLVWGGGFQAESNSRAIIKDSIAAGNFRGFEAWGPNAELNVENSVSANNAVGLFATPQGGTAIMRVSNSTITSNTLFGIEFQGAAQILSRLNNTVEGNAAAEAFSPGAITPK